MSDVNPVRFLLRALALLAILLALWWTLLLDPLLGGLRFSAEVMLRLLPGGAISHVAIGPDRNWLFQVPVPAALLSEPATQRLMGANAGRMKIRSMKLEASGGYPILFTVSFPLFWAILLASPGPRRLVRMAYGTAALAALALLSIAIYALRLVGGYFQLATSGLPQILLDSGFYLAISVIPYFAPLLLALALNGELRALILAAPGNSPAAAPAKPEARPPATRGRRSKAKRVPQP
jgi:hypothetical protein